MGLGGVVVAGGGQGGTERGWRGGGRGSGGVGEMGGNKGGRGSGRMDGGREGMGRYRGFACGYHNTPLAP